MALGVPILKHFRVYSKGVSNKGSHAFTGQWLMVICHHFSQLSLIYVPIFCVLSKKNGINRKF